MLRIIFPDSVKCLLIAAILWLPACKKFITVDPPIDQLNSSLIFKTDNTAIAAVNGLYSSIMQNTEALNGGATLYMGMAADELYYYTPGAQDEFVNNVLQATSEVVIGSQFWSSLYSYIHMANACVEGASSSAKLSPNIKKQVIGEALVVRAMCYFYLVNTFGPVPLVTKTDYLETSGLPRSDEQEIYNQIEMDLKAARISLDAISASSDRTRPDKYAAMALLAKIYLFEQKWKEAELQSDSVINSGVYDVSNVGLNNVFTNSSKETIWQIKPVDGVLNTIEGNMILPATNDQAPTYLLRKEFVTSIDDNDQRKQSWITSRTYLNETVFYPYKYKVRGQTGVPITEYYVVLRLAEQYLIRAEARGHQDNLSEAVLDLNTIRKRAGLPDLKSGMTQSELLVAVQQERRIELLSEWGNRWMDLKRTNTADAILGALKSTWKPTAKLWPVPASELILNRNLLPQNKGY